MSQGRAFRRLNAMGLLLALLPLVFTGIVLPPFWIVPGLAALWALRRREPLALSNAVLNGLAILFVAAVLIAGGWRVGPLRPLGQLLALLAAVRVLMVRDRRSFLAALVPTGLIWVLAVASSTHVTLILYVALSMAALWWGGMRAFLLFVVPEDQMSSLRGVPRLRHAVLAALAVLILAVPVFLAMPRLRSPVLAVGRGTAGVTGFRTTVELSGIGRIRRSGQVAVVVSLDGPGTLDPEWLRLRATAFNLLRSGTWAPRRTGARPLDPGGGVIDLTGRGISRRGAISLDIEVLRPQGYLFLPPGAVAVRCPVPVAGDRTGGLLLPRTYRRPVVYTVWIRPGVGRPLGRPGRLDRFVPRSRAALRELTRTVAAGERRPALVAAKIEQYLRSNFQYTLELPRGFSNDPVADFLFATHRGHCELFAGAMVLMLRSVDIPARMVGGFTGGDLGPEGRVAHVRRANAHTWVEVWLGEEQGWRGYDPTPASQVPGVRRAGLANRLRWISDRIQLLWDRYVLTFGLQDQLDLVSAGFSASLAVLRSLRPGPVAAVMLCLVALAMLLRWRRPRRGGPQGRPAAVEVSRTLDRLERRLHRAGVEVPPSATPRWIVRRAARRWGELGPVLEELLQLAELELYGPGGGPRAKERVREIRRAVRTRTG